MSADALAPVLVAEAEATLAACRAAGLTVAVAESCTGGLVAAALTAVPGSSAVIDCGVVAYANRAKILLLGVPEPLLIEHGAVSEPVARAMAEGALSRMGVDIAVAITGIAGPGGGTAAKPVGLVHFACARTGAATQVERMVFSGDRGQIRLAAARTALALIRSQARPPTP